MKEAEPTLKLNRAKENGLETVKEINRKIREVSVYAIPGLCVRRGDISTPSQLKFILHKCIITNPNFIYPIINNFYIILF